MDIGGLLMKPNFQTLTIKDLKQYILEHREDQEAFRIFMDRIEQQPTSQLYNDIDVDRFSELLRKHQKSQH
jgi:hypothetical protein